MRDESRIRVLIAEDEAHLGTLLENYLTGRGFQVTTRRDGRAALEAMKAEAYDVALLDIVMPELDGLEVLRQVREEPSPPEVIIIPQRHDRYRHLPLSSRLRLPVEEYAWGDRRDRAARWEKRHLRAECEASEEALAIRCVQIVRTTRRCRRDGAVESVAKSDSTVLISGIGTGKELVARALNRVSYGPRSLGTQLRRIAENLLESELFGHEQGAFTGALARTLGLFELAAGGTIFMDEIGELDPRLQGKLLRALELGTFFRVGGTQKVQADLRIIAATNQDLQRVQAALPWSLYYRITHHITLRRGAIAPRIPCWPIILQT